MQFKYKMINSCDCANKIPQRKEIATALQTFHQSLSRNLFLSICPDSRIPHRARRAACTLYAHPTKPINYLQKLLNVLVAVLSQKQLQSRHCRRSDFLFCI